MRHLLSHVANATLGKVFADLAQMEDILAGSGLDWTAIRPPRADRQAAHRQLPDGVRAEHPGRLAGPARGVAHFMLKVPDRPDTVGQAIGIAS